MPSQLDTRSRRRKSTSFSIRRTMMAMALLSTSVKAFTAPSRRSVVSSASSLFGMNQKFSFNGETKLHLSTTAIEETKSLVDTKYDVENKAQGIIGKYEPALFEDKIYKWWEDAGCFQPDAKQSKEEAASNRREPYILPMPPPNVTGRLHMGHAIFVALQDVLARFHRMRGRPVLWLPG